MIKPDLMHSFVMPFVVAVAAFVLGFLVKDIGIAEAREKALGDFNEALAPVRVQLQDYFVEATDLRSSSKAQLEIAQRNLADVEKVNDIVAGYVSIKEAGQLVDRAIEQLAIHPSIISAVSKPWPQGKYCILADRCPAETTDKGMVGYLQFISDGCSIGSVGAPVDNDWHWCHPKLCCK